MSERKSSSPMLILSYIVLVILLIAAIVLGMIVVGRIKLVHHELSLTPTPVPTWRSSVLVVTPDPSRPTSEPDLRTGFAGDAVVTLQTRLQELGYYTGLLDGQFGQGTEAAVVRFQQQHGLYADGVAGQATRTLLYSGEAQPLSQAASAHTAAPATPTPTQALSSTGQLQARLKELGYYTGEVDGKHGPATSAAIRLFQQHNGLEADGIVGPATSSALYASSAKPFTTPVPGSEPWVRQDGLPLLVNGKNHIPNNYQTSELVLMRNYCSSSIVTIKGSEIEGERIAVDALMTMIKAARADGHKGWQVNAGHRSVSYQQSIFDDYVYRYRQEGMSKSDATAKTRQTVADPGASEHHTGLAFDLAITGEPSFGATKQSVWLAQHCWEYGFIIRYPADKTKITGISHEPWHVRYVGVEHSTRMRDEGLCLEEYIEKYGK